MHCPRKKHVPNCCNLVTLNCCYYMFEYLIALLEYIDFSLECGALVNCGPF